MNPSRRGFLGLLASAVAGFALDPERLLWVPGQKSIFIPSGIELTHTMITPDWVAKEVANIWASNLHTVRIYNGGFMDALR